MGINYSIAIGYGIIIDDGLGEEIVEFVEKKFDNADDFFDNHFSSINAYTCEDYFLGFIDYLGDSDFVEIDDYNFNSNYSILDFDTLIDKWKLNDIIHVIDYIPHTYLMSLCY